MLWVLTIIITFQELPEIARNNILGTVEAIRIVIKETPEWYGLLSTFFHYCLKSLWSDARFWMGGNARDSRGAPQLKEAFWTCSNNNICTLIFISFIQGTVLKAWANYIYISVLRTTTDLLDICLFIIFLFLACSLNVSTETRNWQIPQVLMTRTCGARLYTQIRTDLYLPLTQIREWLYPWVFPRINSRVPTSFYDSCPALVYFDT